MPPQKDSLFAYPGIIAQEHGGAYTVVDYDEMRDINGRDEIPEKRVKAAYVSLGVRRVEQDLSADGVPHVAIGKTEGASAIVLYIHGKSGTRKQGVNDFTFGGNFNRVKNLMASSGGLYLSPDFSDFGARGASEVARLIAFYAQKSPGAPVVVACGSQGGTICWALAKDAAAMRSVRGFMLLGSLWDDGFFSSPAFKAKTPVFFGHGTRDPVFAAATQEAFFRVMAKKSPGYPARFVLFQGGNHGTPIRMTDWREALNWIFSVKRR